MCSAGSQSPATRWLVENGPRELELLFRAIVYHPSAPILIADNDRNYRDASAGAGKLLGFRGKRSSAAGWMTLQRPASSPRFRSSGRPFWSRASRKARSS